MINLKMTACAVGTLAAISLLGTMPCTLHADPTDGPQSGYTTVLSGHDDVYHVDYNGGEQGDVQINTDNDADVPFLEIKVYDPDGNLVTRSFGMFDPELHCSWDVDSAWSWRQYTIKVVNFSDHDIPYTLNVF